MLQDMISTKRKSFIKQKGYRTHQAPPGHDAFSLSQSRLVICAILGMVFATSGESNLVAAMVSNSFLPVGKSKAVTAPLPTDPPMPPTSKRSGALTLTLPEEKNALRGAQPLSLLQGRIPGLEKKLASRIVFGTVKLNTLPTQEAFELLDAVWASGCNTFDVAAIYGGGECESVLGNWISSRQINRDDLVVITKGGCEGQDKLWEANIGDRGAILSSLKSSLQRLQIDYIDSYLLHRDDESVPVGQVVDFMSELVDIGVVKTWGVSNWSLDRVSAAIEYARKAGQYPPSIDSPQFSLAKPSRKVWPGTSTMDSYEEYEARTGGNVAVLGWECLAKGFLCGRWSRSDTATEADDFSLTETNGDEWRDAQLRIAYCNDANFSRRERAIKLSRSKGVDLAAIALGYILSKSKRTFALVGTTNASHFIESARAGTQGSLVANMSPAEIQFLEDGTISESLRYSLHQIQHGPSRKVTRALRVKSWRKPVLAALLYSALAAVNEKISRFIAIISIKNVWQ